ncbi:MAG: hypothetical protein Q8P91_00535 [bacterium]|nr:hypothetical protein [bacterium]
MATRDPKGLVTNEYLDDAANTILKGMNRMSKENHKLNLGTFATKEDLKRETSFIRQDISDLRAEISTSPTRKEFTHLKVKVDRFIAS